VLEIPVPEAPDGLSVIAGRWESSPDGREWTLDFELTYRRLA
jgi:hypothetical protein